jgi:hypothetical protein
MNKTETKQLEIFKPYIPAVQAFVDKFIVGTSTIREGLIVGLEGAQRLGYKRAGTVLSKQMIISSEDWAKICTLLGLKSSDGVPELIDVIEDLLIAQ